MGSARLVGIILVMMLAGAPLLAWGAVPAVIAEVQAALDQGDAQHAANLTEKALRQKEGVGATDRACLLLYRGLARELLGAHDAAMHDFTQALDTNALPRDEQGQALLQRGFLHEGLGRLNEAVGDYTAAIALSGYSAATALNNRANIYRRQNKLAEARRDYLAALSADGGQPQYSYFGLGQIAETERDVPAARGFYAKAVIADPDYMAASERLTALGLLPDGVLRDPGERIVLRPLSVQRDSQVSAKGQGDIVLPRPPPGKKEVASSVTHSSERAPSVRLMPVNQLALRPALDQSDTSVSGGAEIQLGAWRSAAEAHTGWDKAKARAGGALDGLSPRVLVADLPGRGRYFRLRVRSGTGQSAANFCARLEAKALACLPVRD
jgi:tetratricopeptide (TPR) repeat protein